jgi:hypothetical protein
LAVIGVAPACGSDDGDVDGRAGRGGSSGAAGSAGSGNLAGTGGTGGTGGIGAGGTGGIGAGGTGGIAAGGSSGTAGAAGSAGAGGSGGGAQACTGPGLPAISDYGARGPFATTVVTNTGPGGQYTMFRPTTLCPSGFKHPPATWGNGLGTIPENYNGLLSSAASHGFVVIASNSSTVSAQLMGAGLDWLIQQNGSPGDFQGKLATDRAVSIGFSLGGAGAVTTGSHAAVKAVVAFHNLQGAAENVNGPLLLLTSTNDGFVTKAGNAVPTYNRSTRVPTLMATYFVDAPPDRFGHIIPLGDAGPERAPAIAWLRYWIYDDQGARPYFFGADCVVCKSPWTDVQRKNATWQ